MLLPIPPIEYPIIQGPLLQSISAFTRRNAVAGCTSPDDANGFLLLETRRARKLEVSTSEKLPTVHGSPLSCTDSLDGETAPRECPPTELSNQPKCPGNGTSAEDSDKPITRLRVHQVGTIQPMVNWRCSTRRNDRSEVSSDVAQTAVEFTARVHASTTSLSPITTFPNGREWIGGKAASKPAPPVGRSAGPENCSTATLQCRIGAACRRRLA
jgi:hypothetical protein